MRKFIIAVILLNTVFLVNAQKIKHPYLIFTPERIQQAKEKVKTDTEMAVAWNEIQQKANDALQKNDLMKCDYLSLAYLMTGETKYSDKVKSILLNAVKVETWGDAEMLKRNPAWNSELQMAHKSFACAVAYDAIYNTLSASERKEIANGLNRLAIQPALGDWLLDPTRIHSLNSMGHNWWSSCVGMAGVLSLSLKDELPQAEEYAEKVNEALPEWFAFNGDVLQNKPKTFESDGGMYESVNYANFGIQEAVLFRLCWQNTHPNLKMTEIPQLAKIPDYFMHVCYPRSGALYSLNFGDSHKNITAESSLEILYALGLKDKNMLWYFSQLENGQNRDGFFRNTPMGFLYMPDTKAAPATPALPLSHLFTDFGWAAMRDSWKKDATLLAVKSGHTWNHAHADANSFILFHNGIDIIKDAGNCWYPNPEYRDYFFQSQAHNVVLFNGEGQPKEQQYSGSMLDGHLYHLLDGGNIKYVLADGTGPVAKNFIRNFRHFLWMDKVIYIIDDLQTNDTGKFEWLWHPNGEVKKSGYDMQVNNGNSSVVIRPLYPEYLAPSAFVHDYPENMYVEQVEAPTEDLKEKESYYSFHFPARVDRVKGFTAIILKDSVNDKNIPQMEKIDGKNWIGVRVKQNGKITDIILNQLADGRLMHSNSWISAEGWETDAYMFTVTYAENSKPEAASEFFVAYGSSLRRGDKSYFSSLSKLYVVKKNTGKKVELTVQGQPLIKASFYNAEKPSSLIVNGEVKDAMYYMNTIIVKIDDRNSQ